MRIRNARIRQDRAPETAEEAFRSSAVDGSVDETVRLEAARGLAEIDER